VFETTEAAEIYHVLTYGSADDNVLVLPYLAAHHGEVRFYPTGMVTLIDYGTETGTYVQNNLSDAESGYVFGSSPLYDYNTVVFDHNTFTIADLRRILLKRNNTDALFTGAEVRQYQRYIRELFEKRNTSTHNYTNLFSTAKIGKAEQQAALNIYDSYGF
jgi:hypothetical protein